MAERFNQDGHLTEAAFEALREETLSEMERLEIAEHLAFCDRCTHCYTDSLTEYLAPPEDTKAKVMVRIHRNDMANRARKYATVSIAACLATVFWLTGAFSPYQRTYTDTLYTAADKVSERTSWIGQKVSTSLNQIFNWNQKEGVNNEKK